MPMSEYLQNFPKLKTNYARSAQKAEQDKNGYFSGITNSILGWKADKIDAQNQKALQDWQLQNQQAQQQAQWNREDNLYKREREDKLADRQALWNREDNLYKRERENKMSDTLMNWNREDSLAAQKQKREDALAQQKRAWDVEDRDAGYQHDMAKFLSTYQQKQTKEQKALDKAAQAKAQSEETARRGLAELQGVADRGNIGAWTRWRQGMGILGDEAEQDLGKQSAALAAIAPAAISKLKEAGVSGVNSLPEFMTYIGLGEDPTSEQIAGALPIIANTLGFSDPAIPATNGVAPAAGAPAPQPVPQAYAKYGL